MIVLDRDDEPCDSFFFQLLSGAAAKMDTDGNGLVVRILWRAGGFVSAPLVMFYQAGLQEIKGVITELEKHIEEFDEHAFLVLHRTQTTGEDNRADALTEQRLAILHRKLISKLSALEDRGMASERVQVAMQRIDDLWEFVTDEEFTGKTRELNNANRARLNHLTRDVLSTVQPNIADPLVVIAIQFFRLLKRIFRWPGRQ